jgi:predicted nucleic acid-binding protein
MSVDEVFFDTNVLLYLLSGDLAKADRAEALLAGGGVVSVQVLNEFAAVAVRKKAVDFRELKDILSAVRVACAVKPLDIETHELGLGIAERYRFSIYDSLIIAAALRARCTVLYSEDLRHGQTIEQMTIRNPFAA